MIFLSRYIDQFANDSSPERHRLADELRATKYQYDLVLGGDPIAGFESFVSRYNWLGLSANKTTFDINQNLARNLPGAMFQDYLISLALKVCAPYPELDIFTEVKVPFGRYPIWYGGDVEWAQPSERSDIAVGYRIKEGRIIKRDTSLSRVAIESLPTDELVLPLLTLNSKIRVSQSEFFDWHGREQLMTKGNPNCFSAQVALRKEMDLNIVEAAQAGDRFFLLGTGGERDVQPNPLELARLVDSLADHLTNKMLLTRG